jgi:hypothetical protein
MYPAVLIEITSGSWQGLVFSQFDRTFAVRSGILGVEGITEQPDYTPKLPCCHKKELLKLKTSMNK